MSRPFPLLVLPALLALPGCWLGEPYEPLRLCLETSGPVEEIDGGRRWVVEGTLSLKMENVTELDPPIAGCDEAPDYVYELEDAYAVKHRLGFTLPELPAPDLHAGDGDIRVTYVERDRASGTAAAFTLRREGKLLLVADTGVEGPVLEDEDRGGVTVERGEALGTSSGSCGEITYYRTEMAGIPVNTGDFVEEGIDLDGERREAFLMSVDDHTWSESVCEEASEVQSYVLVSEN